MSSAHFFSGLLSYALACILLGSCYKLHYFSKRRKLTVTIATLANESTFAAAFLQIDWIDRNIVTIGHPIDYHADKTAIPIIGVHWSIIG